MFDAFMGDVIDQAPEFATSLGIDKGDRAYQKFMVGDRSLAQVEFFKRMNTDQLARLKTIHRAKLTGMDAVNYDVVLYGLRAAGRRQQALPAMAAAVSARPMC